MHQITENIYVETSYLAPNVGCISTSEGCVLIDSPFLPEDAKNWYKNIMDLHKEGIAYLISTDHHFDHILGNCYLSRKTIAHRTAYRGFQYYLDSANLKKEIGMFFPDYLEKWEDEFSQVEIILPQIVFSDALTLHLGNTEIRLKFVGGHSAATILIHIPSEGVLFAGDNIDNELHPAMGGARFDVWLKVLEEIEKMDLEVIVPGHGAVGNKRLATKQRQYFEEMIGYTRTHKAAGMNAEEASQKTAEHMLSYLPVSGEQIHLYREMLSNGAKQMFAQIQ